MAYTYWPISAGGNVSGTGLTLDMPVFGAGSSAIKVGTKSGNTDEVATVTGSLTAGNVAKFDASGNIVDGGAAPAGTVTHTGALTADLPVFGNGTADVKVGTKSGNTDEVATVTGAVTANHPATWDASGNLQDGGAYPYDIASGLPGLPGASALVLIFTATRAITIPANLSGSTGTVGTNPTSTATYTINKNGSSIGAVIVSTLGVVTFTTTSGTAKSLASGDRLTVVAPGSQDATLADVSFTFACTR
jgi:hypothetical protein